MQALIVNIFATFLLGVTVIALFKRLSPALNLVDKPDRQRKHHRGAVPLCGGIAILAAFFLASLVEGRQGPMAVNFWVGMLFLVLLGLIDDRWPLPALGRLVVQLVIAVMLVDSTDIGQLSLGVLLSDLDVLLPLYFAIGVLFIVGLVNAWNMQDGVDGLAGGTAAVVVCWLMLIAANVGMIDLVLSLETLTICICAFLVFNMRSPWRARASVFLGDAGSTSLGAVIAYAILLLATGDGVNAFPSLLWLVIVPVLDTLSLMVRRMAAHRSPMSADRWHLHHLLLDLGFTPGAATMALTLATALCGAVGYAGIRLQIPGEIMALLLVIPVGVHTAFILAATGFATRRRLRRVPLVRRQAVPAPVASMQLPASALTLPRRADLSERSADTLATPRADKLGLPS